MVHRTYTGLGPPDSARAHFTALVPWVLQLRALQAECAPMGPDWLALSIPLDSLNTAAFHFTRRPDFYAEVEAPTPAPPGGNHRLRDRDEALAAFAALRPYVQALRQLQFRCRPYGADYCALALPLDGLFTAAFHFTRDAHLFASKPTG